ncbi:flagellar biosynthesis protein FlhF [Caldinitratiruptor microaerophilus]|uniref:Flagellar biosynthesis protein FlhF n=1 Tax=Caldinitratiruptor microaerophilus TaxID=671077 RepID=A0AA35G5G6_9FIRM|nr:flagellar biosynthesis protein FlhF [Caldinitratiruptor microaerophilus]BDG59371.1 flagellar biosynthesis protein FlhF [Caldinitratiruptor microaerophilus]
MRVKRFLARTLPEAVSQVRAELGPEAVILHTQPVKVGGIFGLFSQKMIEVTAAVEGLPAVPQGAWRPAGATGPAPAAEGAAPAPAAAPAAPASAAPAEPRPDSFPTALAQAQQAPATPAEANGASGPKAPAARAPIREEDSLRAELARLSAIMGRVLDHLDLPGAKGLDGAVRPVYLSLVGRGVEPEIAAGLARRVQGRLSREKGRPLVEVARAVLADHLGLPATVQLDPGGHRVVALVGPTGVGKTTTLAKLAAHWALAKERRVAVMTADTYRIAAVEQLRTYCELIGVPLTVAQSPEDVAAGLEAHRSVDLILVDTAGRSHRNAAQMEDLERYLAALRPDETYLVLSLTASSADAEAVARAYESVGYDRLLFTKLDEATQPGPIINLRARTDKPLSYVTTGQSVPDDIEVASPDRLLPLFLEDVHDG